MSTATAETLEKLTREEQEERLSALLGEVAAKREAEAFTLPKLLGQPQPYDKAPGLFYLRPKLGHKMDLVTKYQSLRDSGVSEYEGMRQVADLIAPYARRQEDGAYVPVTGRDLLYDPVIGFEEAGDLAGFVNTIIYGKDWDKADADPNEATPTPS